MALSKSHPRVIFHRANGHFSVAFRCIDTIVTIQGDCFKAVPLVWVKNYNVRIINNIINNSISSNFHLFLRGVGFMVSCAWWLSLETVVARLLAEVCNYVHISRVVSLCLNKQPSAGWPSNLGISWVSYLAICFARKKQNNTKPTFDMSLQMW